LGLYNWLSPATPVAAAASSVESSPELQAKRAALARLSQAQAAVLDAVPEEARAEHAAILAEFERMRAELSEEISQLQAQRQL
jgi:hypothetical protein